MVHCLRTCGTYCLLGGHSGGGGGGGGQSVGPIESPPLAPVKWSNDYKVRMGSWSGVLLTGLCHLDKVFTLLLLVSRLYMTLKCLKNSTHWPSGICSGLFLPPAD